eukprot:CAMPEP_0180752982 /NCGR_PEP_ID=MMETSP1038_2-20121128/32435_1 /TAXON_ID=632150 /ORGANISM="Azadinium spinosum, Strain 3D9" /LENGTH=48 /DNA_ID= /DNA_START= /DNA_END= /DNA_ORIENTATION=
MSCMNLGKNEPIAGAKVLLASPKMYVFKGPKPWGPVGVSPMLKKAVTL